MPEQRRVVGRTSRARARRVAVVGATGFVGRRLTRAWVRDGADVLCMARAAHAADVPGGTPVALDLDGRGPITPLLRDIDIAYYLVHAMAGGTAYAERDRRYARRFARAARAAGVRRVVYVGALYPQGVRLSTHLASRREVGDILMRGCDALVVRAGVVVGAGSASWELLRAVARLPAVLTPAWTSTRCQPTGIADLVTALQRAADVPGGREVDACGPDVITYADMVRRAAAVMGVRQQILIPAPLLPARIAALGLRALTSVPGGLVDALVESLPYEMVGDGVDLYGELRMRPRRFAATVRAALREGDRSTS